MESNKGIEPELKRKLKEYVYDIIGCCQEVHREMGCGLNEYIYQDALALCLDERHILKIKEWHFSTKFHGKRLSHEHQADFLVKDNVIIECKAVSSLTSEHRQQLWNYMRLSGKRIGILYNFAPTMDQCEKYYYDPEKKAIYLF